MEYRLEGLHKLVPADLTEAAIAIGRKAFIDHSSRNTAEAYGMIYGGSAHEYCDVRRGVHKISMNVVNTILATPAFGTEVEILLPPAIRQMGAELRSYNYNFSLHDDLLLKVPMSQDMQDVLVFLSNNNLREDVDLKSVDFGPLHAEMLASAARFRTWSRDEETAWLTATFGNAAEGRRRGDDILERVKAAIDSALPALKPQN